MIKFYNKSSIYKLYFRIITNNLNINVNVGSSKIV